MSETKDIVKVKYNPVVTGLAVRFSSADSVKDIEAKAACLIKNHPDCIKQFKTHVILKGFELTVILDWYDKKLIWVKDNKDIFWVVFSNNKFNVLNEDEFKLNWSNI